MLHLGINVGLLTSSPINGHLVYLQFEMSLGPQDHLHAQLFGERIHGLHIHCIYTKVYFLKMIISAREKDTGRVWRNLCFLSLCPFPLRTYMKHTQRLTYWCVVSAQGALLNAEHCRFLLEAGHIITLCLVGSSISYSRGENQMAVINHIVQQPGTVIPPTS